MKVKAGHGGSGGKRHLTGRALRAYWATSGFTNPLRRANPVAMRIDFQNRAERIYRARTAALRSK